MYKVLVVDDEPKITELLKVCLEMQGMKVVCAGNGKEALEVFEREKTDIVLTDIMMPVCDGYEFVTKLREISSVPVMFLTAKGDTLDKVKGFSIGAMIVHEEGDLETDKEERTRILAAARAIASLPHIIA